MGFLSRLFGKKEDNQTSSAPEVEPLEYKGYLIYPESISEQGQYRIAGRICKEVDNDLKTHRFIRSDLLASLDSANELMITKSKMCIDQQGDGLFQD